MIDTITFVVGAMNLVYRYGFGNITNDNLRLNNQKNSTYPMVIKNKPELKQVQLRLADFFVRTDL